MVPTLMIYRSDRALRFRKFVGMLAKAPICHAVGGLHEYVVLEDSAGSSSSSMYFSTEQLSRQVVWTVRGIEAACDHHTWRVLSFLIQLHADT